MPLFKLVLENQPIASGILTQSSSYKRAESNLLADEKGIQQGDPCSCLVIHLVLFLERVGSVKGLNHEYKRDKTMADKLMNIPNDDTKITKLLKL